LADASRALLVVEELVSGYGKREVLHGVTLDVAPGEIVALIGHNGAGKSTLLKVLFGLLVLWEGKIMIDGRPVGETRPRELLEAGIAYVPQGNRVFQDLTVRENLEMACITLSSRSAIQRGLTRVFTLFPTLYQRMRQRAGTLSGGEKQMLALANALVLSPRLLLLDEPSLGLAPPLVTQVFHTIHRISSDAGTAVLIVEQKVREVLNIAERVYVLRNGHVSFSGRTESLRDDERLREVYL